MRTRYVVSACVGAPPETVWRVLAELERMPEWTASMTSVRILAGSGLAPGTTVEVRQPRMPTMTWTVEEVAVGEYFRWSARSAGVTTYAEHWLEPAADGGTDVRLGVEHRGPLAGVVGALTMRRTARYVDQELAGLKRASEAVAARDDG